MIRVQSPARVTGQKYCKLFLRVVDKHKQIFAGKETCRMKNWTKAVESDLNQVKKAGTLL